MCNTTPNNANNAGGSANAGSTTAHPASTSTSTTVTAPSKPSFSSSAVRTPAQIEEEKPLISRTARINLSEKQLTAFVDKAIEAPSKTLSCVDYDDFASSEDSLAQLENNVEVETFVTNFEQHCNRYDMSYTMKNFPLLDPPLNDDSDRFRNARTINLFRNWDKIGTNKEITLTQLGDTTEWLKKYTDTASESYLDDLSYIARYLFNSVDVELQNKINAELKNTHPLSHHGGPLTFGLVLEEVINLSPDAIDSLKERVKHFDLKSIPGENVEIIATKFLYAFKRLEAHGEVTPSLISNLFAVFQTSSVPQFNSVISAWDNSTRLRLATRPGYKEILEEATTQYKILKLKGEWLGVSKGGDDSQGRAVFNASRTAGKGGSVNVYCPQCGHLSASCSCGNGNPKDVNIWAPPSTTCVPISTNPLRYQRTIKGKPMFWCSTCTNRKTREKGRWNTTHFTDQHSGKKKTGGGVSQPSANLSEAPPPGATQPASDPSPPQSWAERLANAQHPASEE